VELPERETLEWVEMEALGVTVEVEDLLLSSICQHPEVLEELLEEIRERPVDRVVMAQLPVVQEVPKPLLRPRGPVAVAAVADLVLLAVLDLPELQILVVQDLPQIQTQVQEL
jgi:hypothetical protein